MSHEVDDLYGACRYERDETAGAIGQECWPQSFLPRRRGRQRYLDINECQLACIKRAIASLNRGEGVPHGQGSGRFLGRRE